ncbi:MAG: DUF1559 domain-containing protein [Planctomycetes bacterium]|nr:DUF1559 domain-containing protein [Planctomycetota bacterium]
MTTCNSRLRFLALACANYEAKYGTFPPAYIADSQGRPMHSWRVLILPYLGRDDLYSEYNFDEPWNGPQNIKLLEKMPGLYACPSCALDSASDAIHPRTASTRFTNYAAVLGPRCVFRGEAPVARSAITDDALQTLIIGEVTDANIPWTKPEDIDIGKHPGFGDRLGFSSKHSGRLNFATAAGGTRCLNTKTPQKTVDALFTRDGHETIPGLAH